MGLTVCRDARSEDVTELIIELEETGETETVVLHGELKVCGWFKAKHGLIGLIRTFQVGVCSGVITR